MSLVILLPLKQRDHIGQTRYKLTDLSNFFHASMEHCKQLMAFDDNNYNTARPLACHARIARDLVPGLEPLRLGV